MLYNYKLCIYLFTQGSYLRVCGADLRWFLSNAAIIRVLIITLKALLVTMVRNRRWRRSWWGFAKHWRTWWRVMTCCLTSQSASFS